MSTGSPSTYSPDVFSVWGTYLPDEEPLVTTVSVVVEVAGSRRLCRVGMPKRAPRPPKNRTASARAIVTQAETSAAAHAGNSRATGALRKNVVSLSIIASKYSTFTTKPFFQRTSLMSGGRYAGNWKLPLMMGMTFLPVARARASSTRTQSPSLAQRSRDPGERMMMKSVHWSMTLSRARLKSPLRRLSVSKNTR